MRRLLSVAWFIALSFMASSANAQTVLARYDLSALGIGRVVPHEAEIDGDTSTTELLLEAPTQSKWAVVAFGSDGTICVESWFDPRPQEAHSIFPSWRSHVERFGAVSRLIVEQDVFASGQIQLMLVISLDFHRCRQSP